MSDEQQLVDVIRYIVDQNTENGARIRYSEAYVYDASSYLISGYVDGDETNPFTAIIPVTGAYVGAGDYIQIATDEDGWSWITRIKETALYSKLAVDANRGRVLLGDGTAQVANAGAYGQVFYSGGTGGSAYWAAATGGGGVTAHSALTGLTTGNDHTQYQLRSEENVNNGYAGLGSTGLVAQAQLGTGSAGAGLKYLADDQTYKTVSTASPTFSGAKCVRATAFTFTNAPVTDLAVTFPTEQYDTDSYHSTSSNTTRFTVPTTGYYHVTGSISYLSASGGLRHAWIAVNGTEITRMRVTPSGTQTDDVAVSCDLSLTAGDYIELFGRQNSGSSLNTDTDGATFLTVHAINGAQGATGAAGTNGTNGTNGQGVPTGGSTGQYLNKINGTDYNTQWSTLGTMASQAASSVAITGGSVTGITDLAIADGGTGASTASGARTNLGSTTVGDAVFIAASAAAARTAIGTVIGTDVSAFGHGAADHTDITRYVFLEAATAKLNSGTAANIGASPDLTGVIALADAATQGCFWAFMVPADWGSGVITAQPIWSPGSTDASAHNVRWSMTAKTLAGGVSATNAGTTTTFTGGGGARTAGTLVYDTATSTTLTPAAAGDLFRLSVQRIGADAADTYVGVVNLVGMRISYTANQ